MNFSLQVLHSTTDELKSLQNNHAVLERQTKFPYLRNDCCQL